MSDELGPEGPGALGRGTEAQLLAPAHGQRLRSGRAEWFLGSLQANPPQKKKDGPKTSNSAKWNRARRLRSEAPVNMGKDRFMKWGESPCPLRQPLVLGLCGFAGGCRHLRLRQEQICMHIVLPGSMPDAMLACILAQRCPDGLGWHDQDVTHKMQTCWHVK